MMEPKKEKEEKNIADPQHSFRVSSETIEALQQVTHTKNKTAAFKAAIQHTLSTFDGSSILSKLSRSGQKLPEFVSPREAANILTQAGIKTSAKSIKRYCRSEKHSITGWKLGGENTNSPWVVKLSSVMDFIYREENVPKPNISEI